MILLSTAPEFDLPFLFRGVLIIAKAVIILRLILTTAERLSIPTNCWKKLLQIPCLTELHSAEESLLSMQNNLLNLPEN